MYYRSKCSGHLPEKLIADFTLSGLIKKYLREVFDEKKVSIENNETLWKYYYKKLSGAIDKTYSPDLQFYDEDLANRLKQNISEFSAFKAEAFKKGVEKLLVDEDNHLVPWKEFEKKAMVLDSEYNARYLETEFHHTIATGNMASKLEDFKENIDLYPNLKIVTVNDSRIRPEHKALDGIIKPFDDPFWKTHIPPFDWGCRCDVEQTDEDPTSGNPDFEIKDGFANNPVDSGKVFQSEAYTIDLTNVEKDKISIQSLQMLANNSDSKLQQFAKQKIYELPAEKQFEMVKEFKNGGSVRKHLLVNTKADDYNDIMNVSNAFAKQGKKVEILPEIHISDLDARKKILPNLGHQSSNPDLRIDNVYMDVKRPKAIKNITGNANQASKQNAVAIISDAQLDKKMSEEIMIKRAEAILNDKNKENYSADEIYFFNEGKLSKFP